MVQCRDISTIVEVISERPVDRSISGTWEPGKRERIRPIGGKSREWEGAVFAERISAGEASTRTPTRRTTETAPKTTARVVASYFGQPRRQVQRLPIPPQLV